jgi:cell fate regulator YaaT (PSP1 superfamily)
MPIVCGVKCRGSGKVYYFAPGDLGDLQIGDHVIVETARGREMGQIASGIHEVSDADIVGQLKPVVRTVTTSDLLDAQRYQRQEAEAIEKCKEQVTRYNLPMKMVNAEYSYDGSRLTFFFTSEQRVDFRELVRELARIFRVRIELRQIGVRDEAKAVGGIGKCGRPLCCATWLNEFCPVSIRMAKQQDLPLSPMEISGLCGRLLCCLGYENDYYQSVKGQFPKVGKMVSTPMGPAKVTGVSVLREKVELLFEDGSAAELTADELAGRVPIQQEEPEELSDERARALEEAIGDEAATGDNGRGSRGARERTVTATASTAKTASAPEARPRRDRPSRGQDAASNDAQQAGGKQVKEQGAPASGSSSSRSRRRRPRRSRDNRPSEPQGETSAAPAQATGDSQERGQSARRRPRRRSHKPGTDQTGTPSQA